MSALQVERLARADLTPVRVVALMQQALDGDRGAVREIVTLSLEYSGSPACFVVAARRLFPAKLNPSLFQRHPVTQDNDRPFAFLATLQEYVSSAEYVRAGDGHAWKLSIDK